ncbi:MAG TPA: hypothetical protein PLK99_00010, partial [Burkholderiales bacterium]|nr:hypothetical protein [Burkholderiales bacterium]
YGEFRGVAVRYYDLALSNGARWTSHPNGVFNPGAQNIVFDALAAPYATPTGLTSLTIEGVPLSALLQAQQLTGLQLTLKAGMQAGLPLANPKQAGLLLQGTIFQSFGNWEGTEMTLDLVISPAIYTSDKPGNIVLIWKAGMTLAQALTICLSTAYPNVPIEMHIADQLIQSHDEIHRCSTLEQLAQTVSDITAGHFLGKDYAGVQISMQGGVILVWDNTYLQTPIQLNFIDLIGQPTWIQPLVMQVKTVMRADIQLGDQILMPQGLQNAPGIVQTAAASMPSNLKYKSSFQGQFTVTEMRHIGNYRSPDGAAWATIMNCTANG